MVHNNLCRDGQSFSVKSAHIHFPNGSFFQHMCHVDMECPGCSHSQIKDLTSDQCSTYYAMLCKSVVMIMTLMTLVTPVTLVTLHQQITSLSLSFSVPLPPPPCPSQVEAKQCGAASRPRLRQPKRKKKQRQREIERKKKQMHITYTSYIHLHPCMPTVNNVQGYPRLRRCKKN